MKKILFSTLLGLLILVSCGKDKPLKSEANAVLTSGKGNVYAVDTLNSRVEWKGFKVLKSENTSHFGTIKFESGSVTAENGKLTGGNFIADMSTLSSVDLKDNTEQLGKFNKHLKSGDFFEVEKFPTASFEVTKVSPSSVGDYNTLLNGNLTIKGITKPVQFNANVIINGDEVSIATEPMDINREDFGVKFQAPLANGIIKNEINIQVLVKALIKK